tara:strand:+ start:2421 stop:3878 length:1458 start_codon:yes stop_codon:yes gene_type:complete
MSNVIKLGSITPYKDSVFKIGATTETSIPLHYTYKSGRTPPGLRVEPDGEITGTVKDQLFSLDDIDTTFDNDSTSIDKDFDFTVTATGKSGQLVKEQIYRISCAKRTKDEITNMYGQIFVTETARTDFLNFITDNKIFVNDARYRQQDKNFQTIPFKVLFLAGVHLKSLGTMLNFMVDNNYTVTLNTGEYKSAKAKDSAGNVIYEVVYAELIDPNTGSDNTITFSNQLLPDITIRFNTSTIDLLADNSLPIPGTKATKIFTNAIKRMQDELKAGLTVENFEYLPLWMKSAQDDGLVLGHKNVLPIRYCKAGESNKILYRIKNESTYDIRALPISFDRWILDHNLGTTFDDTTASVSYTGDGSTVTFEGPKSVATDNALIFTVNGQRLANSEFTATGSSIEVNTAPVDGASIVIALKPTTFTGGAECTFDSSSTVTTLDGDGTRFINLGPTFDRNKPTDIQLLMQRGSVTDRITHVSKQRELVRTR